MDRLFGDSLRFLWWQSLTHVPQNFSSRNSTAASGWIWRGGRANRTVEVNYLQRWHRLQQLRSVKVYFPLQRWHWLQRLRKQSRVIFKSPCEYIGLILKLTSIDKLYQPFSSTFMSRFSAPGSRGTQEMAAVQLSASTDMATSRPFWISTERSGMINILFDIHTELFQHWHLQLTAVDLHFLLQRWHRL